MALFPLRRRHSVSSSGRSVRLPSMIAQFNSEKKIQIQDSSRPDEERKIARIVWEYTLVEDGGLPMGMALCIAAPDFDSFNALLEKDPFIQQGVFGRVDKFKWTQVYLFPRILSPPRKFMLAM